MNESPIQRSKGDAYKNTKIQHLPIPFEECMCLLVEDDDDISRFEPRLLVAFPGEGHLLTVLHTLVHRHLQDLPLTIHFTPVALLTPGQ